MYGADLILLKTNEPAASYSNVDDDDSCDINSTRDPERDSKSDLANDIDNSDKSQE